ncbi:hypothetical protein N8T08_010344 [Aspergillus melleus]|uniref:Uncharacterized protein n=1 Tax=Aspergillus melleus TaxID=138277 RepID=A0ACC3ARV1_9EURO|nr:hypothetical protein N8T08_010344 [Aspergillus melleus]
MTMNMQVSGGDCWASSPVMDANEASFAWHPAKPTELDTERRRHQHHMSAGSGAEFPVSPDQDMETPPDASRASPEYAQVDLNDWYPQYLGCMQHFLDHAQHSSAVQSLAAFVNIRLPCQRQRKPILSMPGPQQEQEQPPPTLGSDYHPGVDAQTPAASQVCLRSYIRRLIVTGNDTPPVLQAFFGADWEPGLGCVWKQERVNYLFSAKSGGWASTKAAYDILPDEQTPFLRPLHAATEEELRVAESRWSEWLAMEDWMVGPRSPW